MTTIHHTEFAAIDFEGAGMRPGGNDHPVQIGIAVLSRWEIRRELSLNSLIACPVPVTWSARKVHGISDENLAGTPALSSLWPQIRDLLRGRWVVAHGSATEKRFLRAFPLHGFGPWVDTLRLARSADPGLASHALGDLAATYGLEDKLRTEWEGFRWHDAHSDAVASLEILKFLVDRLDLGRESPEILLHSEQATYRRLRPPSRPK
ncbi:MAG: hypothetical protein Fur0032_12200 [Terrimicrobiaceae bacterium]